MSLPLVSYVIITVNRSDELADCLGNVTDQDYPHREVILVDNGSTDDTREVVKRFPQVRYIHSKTNLGVSGGRNKGVLAAQGEICIFLDDDARFVDHGATRKVVAYFQDDALLAGLAFTIKNAFTGIEDYKGIPRFDKKRFGHDYQCTYFCGAGFALRRKIFLELGMFWERFFYGCEELDFSYRLLDHGYGILRSAAITIDHREVQQARPKGQWLYYNTRNRCWLAWRNLPWPHAASTNLLWWGRTCFTSLRHGLAMYFLRGVRDAVIGLPDIVIGRKKINRNTVHLLKNFSGRLWY